MRVMYSQEPTRASVAARPDGTVDVWLRRDVERDAADAGPDGAALEFWVADERHLLVDGAMTPDEATARFDELWERAGREAMGDRELAEAAYSALADAFGVPASSAPLAARAVAATFRAMPASDEQAVEFAGLWDEWASGVSYKAGTVLSHGGGLYRVSQDHSSQAQWVPGAQGTESLYAPIKVDASGVEEWRRPTGAHDAYPLGKIVRDPDDGLAYRSRVEANVWGPPHETPDYWEVA